MWKDTVMNEGQIIQTLKGCRERHPLRVGWEVEMEIAEAQAKITWDEAIREVVEFVEGNLIGGTEHYITLDGRKWQAFKKKRGIK